MNAEGIFLAERIFGVAIINSGGKRVPVRYVGEQHVKEDLGRIPTVQDWLSQIRPPALDVRSTLRGDHLWNLVLWRQRISQIKQESVPQADRRPVPWCRPKRFNTSVFKCQ